ncbi:MAG: hypothetical protein GY719_05465 [bacterium]|nr:hypothetical protein [bacterium]
MGKARWSSCLLVGIVLVLGAAGPVLASCQTRYCQYRWALRDLEREQELLEAIEQDPADSSHVRQLISHLKYRASHERSVARWRERFKWQAEPRLVDTAADARIEQEMRRWQRVYRQGEPETWSSSCRISEAADPRAELEDLRRSTGRQPDSAKLAGCLQKALVSVGRTAEAEALAEAFLASHPDDDLAWRNALDFHRQEEPGGRGQQLLEVRAARVPNLENRLQLLAYYHRHDLVGPRDALVETLEAEDLPPNEAGRVCWQLDSPRGKADDGAERACERRLFDRLAADPSEETENERKSLVESLLHDARRRDDWATIEHVLASLPPDHLVYAWHDVVDGAEETGCPRFVEAARQLLRTVAPGTSEHSLRNAEALARLFESCSRPDLALETLAPYLASPVNDLEAARNALAAVAARRKLEQPHPLLYDYRRLSGPGSPLSAEERRLAARRWVDRSPDLIEPAHNLIAVYERDGLHDEAARWLLQVAARHPENPDIPLTVGFTALRWRRHDLVASAIGIIEASPHANARHRAEAAYLEGTVARREGHWEQASDLLLHYFTLRQRFDACGECDLGLMAHLAKTGDSERLAWYLEARAAARAEFQKLHRNSTLRRGAEVPTDRFLPQWVETAAAGQCTFPTTAAYLERLAAEGGGEVARKRLANMQSDAICPVVATPVVSESTARALTRIN